MLRGRGVRDKGALERTVSSGRGVPCRGLVEGGGGFGGGTLIGKRLGCMVVARGVGRWGFSALDHFPMPSCHQRSRGFQRSKDILRAADLTNDRSSSD